MSRDLILTDGYLRKKAGELFQASHHQDAIDMQKLAQELLDVLGPQMDENARDYARDYPEILDRE